MQVDFATLLIAYKTFAQAFRHHTIYRVQPYDLKKNVTTTRQSSDEVYLARYETDRRSVYVGNISPTMNESDLKAMFGTIGPVVNMQFIRRQTDDGMWQTDVIDDIIVC